MNKSFFQCLSLVALASLVAFAGPERNPRETRSAPVEFDPDLCQSQMGFDRGYSDGLAGRTMDSSFTLRCREDLRDTTVKGYREGFEKGTAERKEERNFKYSSKSRTNTPNTSYPTTAPQTQEQPNNSGGSNNKIFNINIGGFGGGKQVNTPTGYPQNQPAVNSRAFYCTVTAFGKEFDAFGPTEIEARREATANCTRSYHKMHCDRVECQKNE